MISLLKSCFSCCILLLLFTLVGCNENGETPNPNTGSILIVNEGNFGQGNGSLSLYDRATKEVSNGFFAFSNGNRSLGASVQSISATPTAAYIICNSADKIEVVDPVTLEALQAPIEADSLISPRFMAVSGGKGFVSVWGAFDENFNLPNSKVFVLDLSTNTVEDRVPVNAGPEGILAYQGKVYVANSFTNTVQVLDGTNYAVIETIETHPSPNRLMLDGNGRILTIATGGFGGAPRLQGIDPATNGVVLDIALDGTGANGKLALNAIADEIYFLGAEPFPSTTTRVFEMSIDATSAPATPSLEGNNFYGIGSDYRTGDLYIGDSNSFQGEGTVLRFDEQWMPLDTIPVGVGPNSFLFY